MGHGTLLVLVVMFYFLIFLAPYTLILLCLQERDRQGPDPRFPQSESPPSLDVYQFIWDRTRMVRKDFILQNYVGTGGKCDARAVRCHERIARWHAMCEHQLSHIPEFVNAQSQQNIQEFGQAMKTLNMYYDDSLGRSTVEVPDDEGNETRTDLTGSTYGCTSQLVMGRNPTDFDGTPLKNDLTSIHAERRLIGPQTANSPARGTAEPEMRGLYILTTMNNDGGMEVLKYATYLHRNRPEVYNSRPVQLAMRIFKVSHSFCLSEFVRSSISKSHFSFVCFPGETGSEGNQLCKILLHFEGPRNSVSLCVHHVQTRGTNAKVCAPHHVKDLWRDSEENETSHGRPIPATTTCQTSVF